MSNGWHRTEQYLIMAAQLTILCVCPIPLVEYSWRDNYLDKDGSQVLEQQFLSDYIFAFMLTRLYFLFKAGFNYSMLADPFSKKTCIHQYGFYPNTWFILKTKMQ